MAMYLSNEELFAMAVTELDVEIREHPNFMLIAAASSALLGTLYGAADSLTEHQTLILCKKLGFALESHDDVRVVMNIMHRFLELQATQQQERADAPLQAFDALFFRDRHGRLMARFTIGLFTFDAVELTEEWEVQFVRAYHESLQQALAAGFGKRI